MKTRYGVLLALVLVVGLGATALYGAPSAAQEIMGTATVTAEVVEVTEGPQVTAAVTMESTRSAEGSTDVRLVNASPDSNAVSITFNDQSAADNLAFGDGTDFTAMPSGTYTVNVTPSGGNGTVLSKQLVLVPGASTTLVVNGLVAGTDKTALSLGVYLTERAPTNGKARVEVIHAVPDGPDVDVLVGGKPILTGIKFGKMGDAPINLDPATVDASVVKAGDPNSVVLDLSGTELKADTIYTIIAIGQAADGSVKPLVLTTTSPQQSPSMTATPEATP